MSKQFMLQRRWMIPVTVCALLIVLTSLLLANTAISYAFHAAAELVYVTIGCVILHLCAMVTLGYSLARYWIGKHEDALGLIRISIFALLCVLIFYAARHLYAMPMSTNSVARSVGIWSLALLPLPQIWIIYEKMCANSLLTRILLLLNIAVAAIAFLTAPMGLIGQNTVCVIAVLFMIAVFAVQLVLLIHQPRKYFQAWAIGITIGSVTLGIGFLASAILCEVQNSLHGLYVFGIAVFVYLLSAVYSLFCENRQNVAALHLRGEEYRIVVAQSAKLVQRFDIRTRTSYYHPETAAALGLPAFMRKVPDAMIAMGKIIPKTEQAYCGFYEQILNGEPNGMKVFGVINHMGAPIWLHSDFTTVFDRQHRPLYAIISGYELTDMYEKEVAYDKCLLEYQSLDGNKNTYYELNLTQNKLLDEWGGLLEHQPHDGMGDMPALIIQIKKLLNSEEDQSALELFLDPERLLRCYAQDIRRENLECRRLQEGELRWTRIALRMITFPYSGEIHVFVLVSDIEEEKRREAYEQNRAMKDELTGLLTRNSFTEQVSELCGKAWNDLRFAIIMVDLDAFKVVNDTYGHQFGDKVLVDVAADLRAIMRTEDLIGRFGGDEYMICIKNIPPDDSFLEHRCRIICNVLSKQFGDEIAMTGSLGVSLYPSDGKTFDELYQCADQALYQAKAQGRNCYVFYDKARATLNTLNKGCQSQGIKPLPLKQQEEHLHTLLIVDDQRVNRTILREIFENTYDILEASGGKEALSLLRSSQNTISAVVLDLIMPEMGGLEVLEEMNADPYYQTIPVVVVSAGAEEEYSLKAIERGAVDYVTKPIDERLVRMRVRNAIFRRETENLHAQNRELLMRRASETRHQNQLRYLAEHDKLTHICNKSAFYTKTRIMLDTNPETQHCLVTFDVQRFRAVNDIFGHDEGDRLLRFIAVQLRSIIRQNGTYSRVDTDHFAFCVPYEREALLENINKLLETLKTYDLSFEVLLSFGIFPIEDHTIPISQMYDRAEMAKRTVKDSYLRRWAFYDATMRDLMLEEQEIISHMNAALENEEFIVLYQPKCRLDTGAVVGAEALVRWNHPDRGLLRPYAFIPIFEKNGFIMKLDVYVWKHVCAYLARRLTLDANDNLPVSVNISRANLYNPSLARTLDGLCKCYSVPNNRMHVEITESAYAENAHLLLELTDELHRLGFTVEMDDFGSGYSSLNMLKEIPVDVLKLDMRFLSGLNSNARGENILRCIVRMANQLRLQVISEGVENEEQARFLAGIGCRLAQGYYYAQPMAEEHFTQMLKMQTDNQDVLACDMNAAAEELDRLLCSAAICEQSGNGLRLLSVNEYYLHMMQGQRNSFGEVDKELNRWIEEQDRLILEHAMQQAREMGSPAECIYLQRNLGDHHLLLRVSVRYLFGGDSREVYMLMLTDISGEREHVAI